MVKQMSEKEFIRYLVAGGLTTFVNVFVYAVLIWLGVIYYNANLVALISSKVFSYFANKYFVYRSKNLSAWQNTVECFKYFASRFLTGVIDYVLVFVLIDVFALNQMGVKIFVVVVVIILNYLFGRLYVFKHRKS